MPYATQAQMIARFTEREVIAITDREGTGQIDAAQLASALSDAGLEIDAHLGRRYVLPLARGGVALATPPQLLVGLCCDIARYRLTGTEVQETEAIRNRYKDAMRVLQQLADGELVFGEAPDLLGASGSQAAAGVVASSRRRLFDQDLLGRY